MRLVLEWNGGSAGGTGIGASDLPLGATAVLAHATSLLEGDWQTGTPFIVTAADTNWPIAATDSSAFYRLQIQ